MRVAEAESIASRPVKPEEATQLWDDFLGEGAHTDIHPRTGLRDPNRIVSADGTPRIRMGSHELNSSPTRFHYHEEIWDFYSPSNTWAIENTIVRVPTQGPR